MTGDSGSNSAPSDLRTVVVGMDFSPTAIAAGRWAAETLAPRARILLVHAEEPPARPAFLPTDVLEPGILEEDARRIADERLREGASEVAHRGARTVARVGRPHEVITDVARENGADLIVVGAHGNRANKSWLLGTTADRLVRSADVPVLVGPRDARAAAGRVLVGLDDDPINREVLAWAALFARQLDARLKMLHVLTNRAYSFVASLAAAHAHGDLGREETELREELYGHSHRWLAHCAAAGGDPARVDVEVDWGAASERILAHARHDGVQLIVLGRHRAAGGLRGLLGGTAMRVLHGARCAVAVIPPPR